MWILFTENLAKHESFFLYATHSCIPFRMEVVLYNLHQAAASAAKKKKKNRSGCGCKKWIAIYCFLFVECMNGCLSLLRSWALHVNFQTSLIHCKKEEKTQTSISWKPAFKKGGKTLNSWTVHGSGLPEKWQSITTRAHKLCKKQHEFFYCRKAAASTRWVACTQEPNNNLSPTIQTSI
jgi:hypothetical protein